ncbi:DUF2795 domain-containing protein [Nocardia donostiensis]|uniref:DUF2795 domain-containing protein n=1 Tax=Nocardia donostiensis TaxID=1538463 RepID=A0A1W0ARZ9_9NOCA|nr:DUF2795 domain-containing protein [Nocardia donostiensis]ONM48803.1 DUF2795 domain-containing protein [Nocardia donostiensis]OQS12997.1 DUF2795 domain-containing protein [Nocardia donostiensis]OQS22942.1 DUF2795 domain-containing protein [Nocardia donostiensis]
MSQVSPIQMQKYLSGIDYPCDRDELIQTARANGADERVLDALEGLPDRTFDGPNAVSQAVS